MANSTFSSARSCNRRRPSPLFLSSSPWTCGSTSPPDELFRHAGNRAAVLDDDFVVLDREAGDVVFGRVLVRVAAQGAESQERVQDFFGNAAQGDFGDLDVPRIAVRGRAHLKLAVQEPPAKSDLLTRNASLN